VKKFVLLVVGALLMLGGVARAQTNYPTNATIEIRDENGRLVGEAGVQTGDPLSVYSTGWAPLIDVQATWFSDPIDLGKHKTDKDGVLRFTFEVPDAPPIPGIHTLRLEGLGANGQFRRVDSAIKVESRGGGTTTTTSANGNGNGNNGNGNGNGGGNGSNAGGNGNGNGNGNGSGGGNGSSVLGKTLSNGSANGGGASAYAKTGAFIARTAYVGFALLAVGAALFLAVRKRNVAATR
jgi:hypothetical protein